METVSLIKYSDWKRELLPGRTEVVNIESKELTIEKIRNLTTSEIDKILNTYYPEDGSKGKCIIEDINTILND